MVTNSKFEGTSMKLTSEVSNTTESELRMSSEPIVGQKALSQDNVDIIEFTKCVEECNS